MSVLSRPQGTPERVLSLIGGLHAAGGSLSWDDFTALLSPGYDREGELVKAKPTLLADSTGVATTLGLVERTDGLVRLPAPVETAPDAMAHVVYDRLLASPEDSLNAVLLEAYAWVVAESHRRQDLSWTVETDNKTLADLMSAALASEDEDGSPPMNTTKLPAWRRWLGFLGLGIDLPIGPQTDVLYPTPARRIRAELRRAGVAQGTVMSGEDLMGLLAERCPYLDRGRMFARACERIGHRASPRQLSAALTAGLRDLEADGVLEFGLTGDAGDLLDFVADRSFRMNTFNRVTVGEIAS